MLWKYKKCYQEYNVDTPPPTEICQYLVNLTAIYTGSEFDPNLSQIQYILFNDISDTPVIVDMDSISMNVTINEQIKQGSLIVDGTVIVDENITLTDFWSVQANFEPCRK